MKTRAKILLGLGLGTGVFFLAGPWAVERFLRYHMLGFLSRTKNDMRSQGFALESFYATHGRYPKAISISSLLPPEEAGAIPGYVGALDPGSPDRAGITTPVAYLQTPFKDPFASQAFQYHYNVPFGYHTDEGGWLMYSPGPDGTYQIVPTRDYSCSDTQPRISLVNATFDVTNGTTSKGDIWRTK